MVFKQRVGPQATERGRGRVSESEDSRSDPADAGPIPLRLIGFRGNGKFPGDGALTTTGDPEEQEAAGAIRSRGPPGGEGKSLGPNSLSTHAKGSGEAASWVKGL